MTCNDGRHTCQWSRDMFSHRGKYMRCFLCKAPTAASTALESIFDMQAKTEHTRFHLSIGTTSVGDTLHTLLCRLPLVYGRRTIKINVAIIGWHGWPTPGCNASHLLPGHNRLRRHVSNFVCHGSLRRLPTPTKYISLGFH